MTSIHNMTFARKPAQLKIQRLKEALANGPLTVSQIADVLCLSHEGARNYVAELKRRDEVHIKRWAQYAEPGKRKYLRAFYALGKGKDAKRLSGDATTYRRRWLNNVTSDPDAHAQLLQRKRQWYAKKTFKPRADVAAQWVFREAA